MSGSAPDDVLTTHLRTREWLTRRVDRIHFIDLTTVHRTIRLDLSLEHVPVSVDGYVALGLFRRHAGRAAIGVHDAAREAVTYVSNLRSDELVYEALLQRLLDAKIELDPVTLAQELSRIADHGAEHCRDLERAPADDVRSDASVAQQPWLWRQARKLLQRRGWLSPLPAFDGAADLADEKWGCPAVGRLVVAIRERTRKGGLSDKDAAALVRLLFDWQNNTLLLLRGDDGRLPTSWSTLTISYDEELGEWLPPWERRFEAHRKRPSRGMWLRTRDRISRGGPFAEDLNALLPVHWWRRIPARSRFRWLRRNGRRGVLAFTWHVAWEQSTGGDVGRHHIEVVMPPELLVVRMRLLAEELEGAAESPPTSARYENRVPVAVAADEIGVRAHVLAPPAPARVADRLALTPSFVSVLVGIRNENLWLAGGLLAAATGVMLLLGRSYAMNAIAMNADAVVTALIFAPSLIATWLSFRATSTIAGALTHRLQLLLTCVATLTVGCAVAVAATPTQHRASIFGVEFGAEPSHEFLRMVWLVGGGGLLAVAAVLLVGYFGTTALRREAERRERRRDVPQERGERLIVPKRPPLRLERRRPPTPPPDRWLESGEGDREPWGWLLRWGEGARRDEDIRYWERVRGASLTQNECEYLASDVRLWRKNLDTPPGQSM